MENMEEIWDTYKLTKNPELKGKIISEYAHIVKFIAGRLNTHLGKHVEYDDMIGYGIFGLIDAIDKYNYQKGVKFETYASLRIRGSIIDGIRSLDWVPRTLRQKNKKLEAAYSELELELGREPTELEISKKLDVSVEEVNDLIRKSSVVSLVSLNDYLEQNHEAVFVSTTGQQQESPDTIYERQEAREMLQDAIDKLAEKEKKVITLYYFEELTLKEISKVLGVSESRISQIHSKAVLRLKTRLGRFKSLLMV